MRSADVRHHLILCFALFDSNGFGDALKQIHRRRCIQHKRIFIDHQIRFGGTLQVYPDPEGVGGRDLHDLFQSTKIEKQEFFRKAEIFEEQTVARK